MRSRDATSGCDGTRSLGGSRAIRSPLRGCRGRTSAGLVGLLAALLLFAAPVAADAESCPNAALRAGASEGLPDCRAYEQVTPQEKGGFDVPTVSVAAFPAEASADGASLAYMTFGAFAEPESSVLANAYVVSRASDSWRTSNVTPPSPQGTPGSTTGYGYGYDFSPDLSEAVLKVPDQSLAPSGEEATPNVYNLFLRHPGGAYSLVTSAPPTITPGKCNLCYEESDVPGFMGANAGAAGVPAFTHILFEANESLTTNPLVASEELVANLYESDTLEPASQRVHPVGILPDGGIATGGSIAGAGLGYLYDNPHNRRESAGAVANAISADGSHVLFEAAADGGAPDPEQAGLYELYDRIDGTSTVEVSAPALGATPANSAPGPATFWDASQDGSEVLFTSTAELTTQSNTGPANEGNDLYLYSVETGHITDLTVDGADSAGAGVLGIVGASQEGAYGATENGGYVYFVATGQLEAGKGTAGEPNLYVAHDGTVKFITTLNPADAAAWTATASEAQAYVTPDGRHLALMSINPLTGYDNRDEAEPTRSDTEVYEYGAEEGLSCASCNPSGARPVANASIEVLSTPFYHPRILSNDGSRLYFTIVEASTSAEHQAFGTIFEYEKGQAQRIAANASFLDASASGGDVFVATRNRLALSDEDEFTDVYDARVNGGISSMAPPVACTASACRAAYAAPPASSTPASNVYSGMGNLVPPPTPAAKVTKPTKSQLLARALKTCAKLKSKARRAKCVSTARRRYAAKSRAARHSTARGSHSNIRSGR
jgi:hypothetical protein